MGQTSPSQANARNWKLAKQEASNCSKTFAKQIKSSQKEKKGLSGEFITSSLACSPNFIGCFAEDELNSLTITSFPSFLIANIDSSEMKGSHWIAIGIFNDKIEIFDPLGFDIFNWSKVPCDLLDFLHRLSVTRRVHTAPRVQSDSSYLCGFYTIFYVIARKFVSFEHLFKCFCTQFLSRNDKILYEFFKNADGLQNNKETLSKNK